MRRKLLSLLIIAGLSLPLSFLCGDAIAGADTNATAFAASPSEAAASNETLRSYLQLQEQIHATQLAIERASREMELATLNNAAVLSNRIQAVEQSINEQQAEQLRIVRSMMFIAGTFVMVGVLALLMTAYFHWRAVNRLTEIASALPRGLAGISAASALGAGNDRAWLEQNNSRLLGAIERLEKRILEIESVSSKALTNGGPAGRETREFKAASGDLAFGLSTPPARVADSVQAEKFVVLLNKGTGLLSGDKTEEALACFEEALLLDPQHTELLVKKGEALERLRRSQEAIECYDRAIATDNAFTIAYLHKGGLLNRMERFDEAMQCYEQALRTQERRRAA